MSDKENTETNLITICTVNDPVKAELIKIELANQDIRCEIGGEHQGGFTGTLSVELIVREEDAEAAKAIIEKKNLA